MSTPSTTRASTTVAVPVARERHESRRRDGGEKKKLRNDNNNKTKTKFAMAAESERFLRGRRRSFFEFEFQTDNNWRKKKRDLEKKNKNNRRERPASAWVLHLTRIRERALNTRHACRPTDRGDASSSASEEPRRVRRPAGRRPWRHRNWTGLFSDGFPCAPASPPTTDTKPFQYTRREYYENITARDASRRRRLFGRSTDVDNDIFSVLFACVDALSLSIDRLVTRRQNGAVTTERNRSPRGGVGRVIFKKEIVRFLGFFSRLK